jgi:hypothetical protein
MKLFSLDHHYNHPWERVTEAQFRKYPNTLTTHVIHCDVIDRKLDPDTGVLRTEKILAAQTSVPKFLQRFFSSTVSYCKEVSTVDPFTKIYTSTSENLSFSEYVSLKEKMVYKIHPDHDEKTLFTQECIIEASVGQFLTGFVEDFCLNNLKTNAEKGRKAIEEVINTIKEAAATI